MDLVTISFIERDAWIILVVLLSQMLPEDSVCRAFTENNLYFVKTSYMVGKSSYLDLFYKAWIKLWSFDITPKFRLFLWRAYIP